MQVMINGKKEFLEQPVSIIQLLLSRGLKPETVVVEHNHGLIDRADWSKVMIKEEDTIEILRFVGGG